jgi:molybdenum cofactor biosynthesis protein MoaC
MAAKKTADFIPFCHHIPIDSCDIRVDLHIELSKIEINCVVKTASYKTGVEMEALVGATHTALTMYDMLKAISHGIEIQNIKLIGKTGGKSHYTST